MFRFVLFRFVMLIFYSWYSTIRLVRKKKRFGMFWISFSFLRRFCMILCRKHDWRLVLRSSAREVGRYHSKRAPSQWSLEVERSGSFFMHVFLLGLFVSRNV